MNYKLKKISGDASFREFYRLQKGKNTSIIVQAKKEKFKNLITYIVVNKILARYKIYAPKLISNHYEHNIIEITDLGQKPFYNSIITQRIAEELELELSEPYIDIVLISKNSTYGIVVAFS